MIVGIIGGSGITDALLEGERESHVVETACGAAVVTRGAVGGQPVAFIARHGEGHALLPHRINYCANALALHSLGVTRVIATAACGSLSAHLPPGTLALLTDFIDFTHARPWTLTDAELRIPDVGFGHKPSRGGWWSIGDRRWPFRRARPRIPTDLPPVREARSEIPHPPVRRHADMSEPYCAGLRANLAAAAAELSLPLHPQAVYVCVEGPRYETHAEIRMFQVLGADLVGMTGVPEATFALELGQCYASIAIVTNAAAGLAEGRLSHDDVHARVTAVRERVTDLIRAAVPRVAALPACTSHSI